VGWIGEELGGIGVLVQVLSQGEEEQAVDGGVLEGRGKKR
jgi:hypothetical protein